MGSTDLKLVSDLKNTLKSYNQEHLLQYWDQLNDLQKVKLIEDVQSIDLEKITSNFKATQQSDDHKQELLLQPIPDEIHDSISKVTVAQLQSYQDEGHKQIRQGKVAALLLAGGQGTRLGVSYPKGMYDVGLLSKKTLYQLQAERILKLQELASDKEFPDPEITWYIMTSEHTMHPTIAFFEKNLYFNLKKENIKIFEQNMIPCYDFEGKIILETPWKISRAPDGNGGLYCVLESQGIINDMASRGIEYIHVYCVDNILVKMADPVFIGYCISKESDCGAKVVEKVFPKESVGVVSKVNGKYQVVEYSELSEEAANERNEDGRLAFNAGSICNHFFTFDFLKKMSEGRELKHHVAKKKIPYTGLNGELVKPTSPNGIKLEKFVFDVFEFSNQFCVWEVLREDEFSPLKNADGAPQDTPTTARKSLFHLHQRYIKKAGGRFAVENGKCSHLASLTQQGGSSLSSKNSTCPAKELPCEITPLVSYDGEGLEELCSGKEFTFPVLLSDTQREIGFENGISKI